MKKIVLIYLLTSIAIQAQEKPLDIFKPLENYVWKAEGVWSDGSQFKQEISFKFSLNSQLVNVQTLGYVNKEQTEFGLRNQGIRQYDQKLEKIRFWEFDVFGGLTKGTVEAVGDNLIYTYDYGGTTVTEMWIYKNERTYDYIVGIIEDGKWQTKFLETEFSRN